MFRHPVTSFKGAACKTMSPSGQVLNRSVRPLTLPIGLRTPEDIVNNKQVKLAFRL